MTPDHLLPANATPLEQALSLTTNSQMRLALHADALRRFKSDPADPLLPWLIWEYGLGELLPHLPEPRRAIAEGIRWQRLRGTPAALATAIRWVTSADVRVEEEEPTPAHWAEFQLDPGAVPATDAGIAALIEVSRLSAPARSRLSRIYHGHDLRRFVLSRSTLGDALLSDHSGVFWTDGQTKLSFGRVRKFAHPPLEIVSEAVHAPVHVRFARLMDRCLLDWMRLGECRDVGQPEIIHAHLWAMIWQAELAEPSGFMPERRFCKAGIALSDSWRLGETNACLPRFVLIETGAGMVLSSGRLSATPHAIERREVLERIDADHPSGLILPPLIWHTARQATHTRQLRADEQLRLGVLRLGDERQPINRAALRRQHTQYSAAPDRSITRCARSFLQAQIAPSDSGVRLGDINTRTPRRGLYRIAEVSRLSQMHLGDGPEVAWREITECSARNSTLNTPAALVAGTAHGSAARLFVTTHAPDLAIRLLPSRATQVTASAAWTGQTWTGMPWIAQTWANAREHIQTHHHGET